MIRHVSLDMWNTVIAPNPAYAIARDVVLADVFSTDVEIVTRMYKIFKEYIDDLAMTGVGISSKSVYRYFCEYMNRDPYGWKDLRMRLEAAFVENPPMIDERAASVLKKIADSGITMSIASNTNFIRGTIIRDLLDRELGIDWSFAVFSDEIAASKPGKLFWAAVRQDVAKMGITPGSILHIGDDAVCDGSCVDHGFMFSKISGPGDLASALEREFCGGKK